jgi:CheY-like chemotaxis protein
MSGDRKKILDSGCDDYISKAFNIQALLAMIERMSPPYPAFPGLPARGLSASLLYGPK